MSAQCASRSFSRTEIRFFLEFVVLSENAKLGWIDSLCDGERTHLRHDGGMTHESTLDELIHNSVTLQNSPKDLDLVCFRIGRWARISPKMNARYRLISVHVAVLENPATNIEVTS